MADEHQFLGRRSRYSRLSPQLSSRPAAHIVNISSIFGIIAPPGQTAYCASKFAVRGFSEALRHELKLALSPVKLSVVHPGGIATNIVRNMRTGVAVTDNARRAEVSSSSTRNSPRPRPRQPRRQSSLASRRTRPGS